jgi:Rieske Fe-S protein
MAGAVAMPWLGCGGHVAAGQSDASPEDGSSGPDDGGGGTLDATTDASTMEPDVTSAMDAGAGDDGSVADQDAGLPGDACLPGNVAVVPFALYPGLDGEAGYARLAVPCYSDPICGENLIIVVRTAQGEYLAFSDACTHACCDLNFTGSQLVCPCCHSVFDMQGNVVSGPAPQPIPVFATRWDEDAVYVTL